MNVDVNLEESLVSLIYESANKTSFANIIICSGRIVFGRVIGGVCAKICKKRSLTVSYGKEMDFLSKALELALNARFRNIAASVDFQLY